jgi:glyceraldehyde 3-phosphate dehydrogenase
VLHVFRLKSLIFVQIFFPKMQSIRVAINGFGRIGRNTLRVLLQEPGVKVVGINDLADCRTLAHLFKYDSVHGVMKEDVVEKDGCLLVNDVQIPFYSQADIAKLPWGDLNVDVVIESTGKFTTKALSQGHLSAGAKKVIISAPAKDEIPTVCMGINEEVIGPNDLIISNASCTTNNVAPLVKIIDENWGIVGGYITTIHSYTGDQRLHDQPHKDLRRARAAAESIIPTTTGAAKAITNIFPHLKGHLGGAGIRVPVPNGSLTDFTCTVKRVPKSIEEVNKAFENASNAQLKGILEYTDVPIVSKDVVGNPHSCVLDSLLTSIVGDMVKVVGWYDNEMGYSNRLKDLIIKLRSYL